MNLHEQDIICNAEPVENASRSHYVSPFTSESVLVRPPSRIVGLIRFRIIGLALLIGGFGGLAIFAHQILGLPSRGFISQRTPVANDIIFAYFVLIPAIPMTLGLLIVPTKLGRGTTVFSKMQAPAVFLYCLGIVCLFAAWLMQLVSSGAPTPMIASSFSGDTSRLSPFATVGILSAMLCNFAVCINLLATICQRRQGSTSVIYTSPFLCGILCTSVINLLVLPFAGLAVVLTWLNASTGESAAATVLGPDSEALRLIFLLSHESAVTVAALPAIGLTTEIIARYNRAAPINCFAINLAIIALAVLAIVPSNPNIVPANSGSLMALTSGLAMLGMVPLMVIVVCWCLLLRHGIRNYSPSLLFALGSMLFFANSIFTKLTSAPLSSSLYFGGSGFEASHLHMLWLGGIGLAGIGGVIDVWILISKRSLHSLFLIVAWVLMVEGAVVTYFPGFLLGARSVRPGTLNYFNGLDALSTVIAAGQVILLSGIIVLSLAYIWPVWITNLISRRSRAIT